MGRHSNRVLVCGGRKFANAVYLFQVLDDIHLGNPITLIIHGAAPGADLLAEAWAKSRKVAFKAFPANWNYGRAAGGMRNAQMLREGKPNLVVTFPGGKGTNNMKAQTLLAKIKLLEFYP